MEVLLRAGRPVFLSSPNEAKIVAFDEQFRRLTSDEMIDVTTDDYHVFSKRTWSLEFLLKEVEKQMAGRLNNLNC
jgi:hypothetical protein